MLLTHISTAHGGEVIHAAARESLTAMGRGMCSHEGCGALRAFDTPRCRKCRHNAAVRQLAAGDEVPSNSSRAASQSQQQSQPASAPDAPAGVEMAPEPLPEFPLPGSFLERVKALGPQTMLQVPKSYRHLYCSTTASCVESCNAGDASGSQLEQARARLLLAHVPRGGSLALEMRTRFDSWQQGQFLEIA